jgi:hypothetical protein
MRKRDYIVEIRTKKSWEFYSSHGGETVAKINAETISSSRKCAARVKHKGTTVYEVGTK